MTPKHLGLKPCFVLHFHFYVTMEVILYIFRIGCILFFCYIAIYVCFLSFINQEIITSTSKQKQQDYQRPLVCVTALQFNYAKFNSSYNITFEQYRDGRWKVGNLTEEETFSALAPKLSDLVKSIQVCNTSGVVGDSYEIVTTSVDRENLSKNGIDIIQKDYYHYLSNHCIKLR